MAHKPTLSDAHLFLGDAKRTFVARPGVYRQIVKELNVYGRVKDPACVGRIEALLAGEPRLLKQFRAFMPRPGRAEPAPRIGKGEGKSLGDAITLDDDEEEAPAADADGDDDFEIVKTVGSNALVDFPHPRFACVVHRFPKANASAIRAAAKKHCAQCYCFVCDGPAAECASWNEHAIARDDEAWRAVRAAFRAPTPPPAPAPPCAPYVPAKPVAPPAHVLLEDLLGGRGPKRRRT